MATHDVVLNGNQKPRFPDLCVGCEVAHPGHVAKIAVTGSASTFGWAVEALELGAGVTPSQGTNTRVKLEVPCCPKCARALERRHFWKTIALYASGFGGAAMLVLVIVKGQSLGIPAGLLPYVGLVVCLGIVALPVIWEFRSPPAFTITPSENRVVYEFKSARCAEAFAALNQAEG